MKPIVFLGFILSCYISCFAQTLSTQQLIDAWKVKDTSQTAKAEITYTDLRKYHDSVVFRLRIAELGTYLKDHLDERLQIRTWMYEILGKRELHIASTSNDKRNMIKAMEMAGIMGDEQLLSELYSLYPTFENRDDEYSYYILSSLEMQEQIGAKHFPMLYLRYISFSLKRYSGEEYRQCIYYGTKALELMKNESGEELERTRILESDYIGSCYKQLGMPDSVLYYYRSIQQYLLTLTKGTIYVELWEGVAAGGIGYSLLMQKKYVEALPYLLKNISTSVALKEYKDAAISEDALAQIDFAENKYDSALFKWRIACQWYGDDTLSKMHVFQNISALFRNENKYDSAYYYYQQYNLYKAVLDQKHNAGRLAVLKSRIEFTDMQNSLQKAKNDISHEKNIRLVLLVSMLLLTVIAILWYNRYRLKQKYLMEQAESRQHLALLEVEQAKEQVKNFADKIKERETLIEQLKTDLNSTAATQIAFNESLLQYSLVTNEEWDKFRKEFIKAYPVFYTSLQKIIGHLTPAEERLAALLRLQLDNREIGHTLGIAPKSVNRSKLRLKLRLQLPEDISLESYLINL